MIVIKFIEFPKQKVQIGIWIDLTNTSRFYSQSVVTNAYGDDKEVKYFKLQCRGHGETPSEEQSKLFINVCKNFISKYPLDVIGKLACVFYFCREFLV